MMSKSTFTVEYRPQFEATRKSTRIQVLTRFIEIAECNIERMVEGPNGWLMLASVPGRPHTGGIYLYNESDRTVLWVAVNGRDEDFTGSDFDRLLPLLEGVIQSAAKPVHVSHNRRPRQRRSRKGNRAEGQSITNVGASPYMPSKSFGGMRHTAIN